MAARLSEQSYRNEDQVTFKQKVKTFLYNPKEGTVCQRNCSDWIKLLLYIIVFTAIILIMTYLILHHYYSNLMDETHPHEDKFTTSDKIDPGLSFFPNINEISPIIYYSDKTRKASDYIDSITEIFDEYDQNFKHRSRSVRFVNCERPNFKGLRTQEYCLFNRDSLMNCSTSDFGYNAYQPCFYLKINKLPTWTPVYYDKKLPTNMPKSLQKHINEHSQEKIIWVDCAGRRTSDMEYLGELEYYPFRGFSSYHFPHRATVEYVSPLVAVKLLNVRKNVLVTIECSLWAKNFKSNKLIIQVYME